MSTIISNNKSNAYRNWGEIRAPLNTARNLILELRSLRAMEGEELAQRTPLGNPAAVRSLLNSLTLKLLLSQHIPRRSKMKVYTKS
ncbi:hypothetical protein ACTXT7_003049 [Hymenolepis weldensis]